MSKHLFILAFLFVGGVLAAQTYQWSPPNTGSFPGGSNNTIPYWAASGTYQQIHDAPTMDTTLTMKGIGMRPAGNRTVKGRSWDMRLSVGYSKNTARTPSMTFSSNFSTPPTIVFGTSSTWKTFSWPDFTTSGTTPAFVIPFSSPFPYIGVIGNFCWEWRHKNGSITTSMPMDAASGLNQKGSSLPSSGVGCTATGGSSPATASMAAVPIATRAYQHDLEIRLQNAAGNANTMMALSLSNTTTSIGWCAPVITPLLLLPAKTDAAGAFSFKDDLTRLAGSKSLDIYTQFGFADSGLPGGIGLSNVAGYKTPAVPGAHGICRLYKTSAFSTSNGDELATTAAGSTLGYGLSVAFLK